MDYQFDLQSLLNHKLIFITIFISIQDIALLYLIFIYMHLENHQNLKS
jgi:hypothetical protein